VKEQGGTIMPWKPSKEFIEGFSKCMEKSIQESRINLAKAIEESKNIFINI
jgi:hypothetical protein